MARGVNRVTLIGNLGDDPTTRYMPSGGGVTSISLATSSSWKDKSTGEQRTATEWHQVTFFNKLAEIAGEYLKKGSQVYIEGSLRTEKYTDKQGVEKYSTKIIANEMNMLGSAGGNQAGGGRNTGQQSGGHQQSTGRSQSANNYANASGGTTRQRPPVDEGFDDGIPF